ncbi:unnamed protein product [Microthlaspi erraticum]|uniref:DC1 domain-containing protein n=1 Tax=Microthlaspi erraticum TaxID=1685480 RepID=A0A6D2HH15_9BRAS|nr:unnamed protein product [Microthlaspi erraticum]
MPRCIVSDPAQPHNVSRRAYQKIKHNCFACKNDEAHWVADRYDDLRFYCTTCDLEFHDLCLQFPSKMIHPYHPQHPLTFTFLNYETGIMADTTYREFYKVLSCFELDFLNTSKAIGQNPILCLINALGVGMIWRMVLSLFYM